MKRIYYETRKFISETCLKEHDLINKYNSLDLKVPGRERPDPQIGFAAKLQKRYKLSNSEPSLPSVSAG